MVVVPLRAHLQAIATVRIILLLGGVRILLLMQEVELIPVQVITIIAAMAVDEALGVAVVLIPVVVPILEGEAPLAVEEEVLQAAVAEVVLEAAALLEVVVQVIEGS
jgi:hypothetical protein